MEKISIGKNLPPPTSYSYAAKLGSKMAKAHDAGGNHSTGGLPSSVTLHLG